MATRGPRAAAVVVGEPSRMQVVTGHKGGTAFKVHVKGFEVHSSIMHTGVSAVLEAGRLLDWVNRQNAVALAATPGPVAAMFDPPCTLYHCGTIAGGTAHNITAGDCRLGVDMRVVPGDDMEARAEAFRAEAMRVSEAMRRVRPEAGITLDRYFTCPPLVPETHGASEALCRRLTGDNATHVVSYGTEAGHFQAQGYSAAVCGPGDIAQAHQPDEYLEMAQWQAGLAFMRRVVADLAA
jgi:acetylornithine deacetylase